MDNFIYKFKIDKDICNGLIQYHKDNVEYKFTGSTANGVDKNIKDSTDVIFFNDSRNELIKKYFNCLSKGCREYLKKYSLTGSHKTNRYTLIQHYKPGEGFYNWHMENSGHDVVLHRHLVFMTYLNTLDNAGTEFFHQKTTTPCHKGLTVIWPAAWTHTHKGVTNHDSDKYIITGWWKFHDNQ